ncbi:MAG: GHKL domain-containing protein, partial [Deltaproteobacteria bacterium]|nr:GHKL domain-containing protein [Deltaproteobacteria bacterium]
FHVTAEYQMFGMLFPIRIKEKMRGVMAVVVDLKPMVKRYIAPMRSGKYGAGYLLDGRGIVVYDHETQIIGRSIFDGMHASYPDLMRVDRLLVSESSGMEEYHFTVKRTNRVSRKLIAWHALDVCGKKLVIALSAPDMEINKIVSEDRLLHLILGGSFGLALLGMSILFFRARQQLLDQSEKEIRGLERVVNIQEKMSSLGRVAAGISHEIRNPLSTVNVYLSVLRRVCANLENLDPNVAECIIDSIEEMESASNKIESVVKSVIDFSKPNKLKLGLTDINKCIRKTVDLSAVNLRKMGINMKIVLDDDLPECWLDSQSIAQIMLNLTTNAAEAMEGIKGHKQIEITTSYSNKFITVIVSDSGPGVPPDIQNKIFEPFYTTKNDGSGIGLSISRRIISDHSGFLNVSQSKWGGAEFTIKLPIEKRTGRI